MRKNKSKIYILTKMYSNTNTIVLLKNGSPETDNKVSTRTVYRSLLVYNKKDK